MSNMHNEYLNGVIDIVNELSQEDELNTSPSSIKATSLSFKSTSLHNISNRSDTSSFKKQVSRVTAYKENEGGVSVNSTFPSSSPLNSTVTKKRAAERDFDPFFTATPVKHEKINDSTPTATNSAPTANFLEFSFPSLPTPSGKSQIDSSGFEKYLSAPPKLQKDISSRLVLVCASTLREIVGKIEEQRQAWSTISDSKQIEIESMNKDYMSLESSFRNLHDRFEKSRSYLKEYEQLRNEMQDTIESLRGELGHAGAKYNNLMEKAQHKLDEANSALEDMAEKHSSAIRCLEDNSRKIEMKYALLVSQLNAKESELAELRAICNKFIK